jgi:hypothetical protein
MLVCVVFNKRFAILTLLSPENMLKSQRKHDAYYHVVCKKKGVAQVASASQQNVKQKPAPSRTYLRFESVVSRGLKMLSLQPPIEKLLAQGGHAQDLSDMSRSSVVLAVAAMDAYFTGVFAERLVPFIKQRKTVPKALTSLLEKAGLDAGMALELLGMDRPYRRVRKLMDSYLAQHVTQRIDVIDELFLAYGLKDFCHHVEKKAGRKNLLAAVRNLVGRRHEIVHKGDLNSHGRLQIIDAAQTRRRIMNIVTFVASADEILHNQLY